MIVGISGYARSGKDTVADHLVAKHGFEKIAFADPLREAVHTLDPWVGDWGDVPIRYAEAVDNMGYEAAKEAFPEIRRLLQRMGTEVGRELWGEGFWVEQLGARLDHEASYVIPDCRFPSEASAVQSRWGGVMWRVTRPGFGPVNEHPSEVGLDDWRFDCHVLNDKTPAALCEHVDWLLEPT